MSHNVGREDRLVRAGVALSLLLMAGFAVVASGGLGAATLGFAVLAAYFVVTAAVGRDPIYSRLQIDTQVDRAEPARGDSWAPGPADPDAAGPQAEGDPGPVEIDLREPRLVRDGTAGALGDS